MKAIYAVLLVVLGFFSTSATARDTSFECTVDYDGIKVLVDGVKVGNAVVFSSYLPTGEVIKDDYNLASPDTSVVKGKEQVTNNPFVTLRGIGDAGSTKAFIYTDTPQGPNASWVVMDDRGNTNQTMDCDPGSIKTAKDFDAQGFDSKQYITAKEVSVQPPSGKNFKASSASIYLQNNTYLPAWGVTITSLEDDVTITGVVLNRGNCIISTADRGKNMNLKMQYGSTFSFTTPSNNGWTQCQPLELLIKTNRGDVTLGFNY